WAVAEACSSAVAARPSAEAEHPWVAEECPSAEAEAAEPSLLLASWVAASLLEAQAALAGAARPYPCVPFLAAAEAHLAQAREAQEAGVGRRAEPPSAEAQERWAACL